MAELVETMEQKGTVLIVDDNEKNQAICVMNLEMEDYKVYLAGNGKQGLESARENNPDLILLDIMMPVMDGYEMLEALKAAPDLASIPVLMLTARAGAGDVVKALEMGARDYLKKPFDIDELVARVNTLVTIKQNQDKRKQAEEATQKAHREETKLMEEQLRQAQKSETIGTLAGGIAHDFNNILMSIIGYTGMALCSIPEEGTAHEDLHEVLKAADRAKELVKQILTLSRQVEHERKPVQMSLIVKEALKLLRSSLPSTIEIRQNIEAGSSVMADPTHIHQVMMNLCTNAAHAMRDKGGALEVDLLEVDIDGGAAAQYHDMNPGPYLRLTVSDTGHGMAPWVMERIFDPYFTTKERDEGTGLGLAVVHGIVKSHGGAITVNSEPGKGTTFHIFFPRIESRVAPHLEVAGPPPRGNEYILFVDDEEPLVKIVRRILERLGYKVVARTSSIETLEIFRAQPDKFDLVITDQTMPNMTGVELSKELTHIRPDMPIILCTGFSEAITPEKAKEMGIRAYVTKPIVPRDMAEVIRRVLDKSN